MPIESFFDLAISPVDLQRAAAEAMPAQLATRRAVQPAVSLRGAYQDALLRQRLGQELATRQRRLALGERELALGERRLGVEQRRLDLAGQAADYQAGQLPFEIAAGLVSGGTRFYGGYRALQESEETKKFRQQMLALQRQQITAGERQTASLVDAYTRVQRELGRQGYPRYPLFEQFGP